MALTFSDARARVLREAGARRGVPVSETTPLLSSLGRVLAQDAAADRDYPPFDRSVRDGFAVRSADLPGRFRVVEYDKVSGEMLGVPMQNIGLKEAIEKTAQLIEARADSHFFLHPVGFVN